MSDAEISDAELLKAFSEGNACSLNKLIQRYKQPIFSWLLGMTGNHADAEDIYQDVWVRVIRHADRFHDHSFRAWLWQITRNLLIDFRRKRKADVSLDATVEDGATPLVDLLTDKGKNPAQTLEQTEMLQTVMRAVLALPELQREVFLMRVQGELSFSEIALTLKIPLNTALGRMHDAMEKLKKIVAAEPGL